MKLQRVIVALAVLIGAGWCGAEVRVEVKEAGKPIQPDGFLLEWRPSSATVVDKAHDMRCEAVNTGRGLSGYVRYAAAAACWQWRVRIFPRAGAWQRHMDIVVDSVEATGPFHAIDRVVQDSIVHVAVEWVIPWDSLAPDESGGYEVGFALTSPCRDTAEAFVVAGTYNPSPYQGVWTPRLRMQAFVIAALLVLYLVVYSRSKKTGRIRRRP